MNGGDKGKKRRRKNLARWREGHKPSKTVSANCSSASAWYCSHTPRAHTAFTPEEIAACTIRYQCTGWHQRLYVTRRSGFEGGD